MSDNGGPSSRKRLIEIDDQLLDLAQALLGDVTIRETVDTALRLLVQDREIEDQMAQREQFEATTSDPDGVAAVIRRNPGISLTRLTGLVNQDSDRTLIHPVELRKYLGRIGRSLGVGEDSHGRWWSVDDNKAVAHRLLSNRSPLHPRGSS